MSLKLINGRKLYEISDATCRDMLLQSDEALANCYPQSGKYAAAVLTEKGNIYTGASYSSDTDTLTMHGEAVALAHAAQHGEKEIVAITGPSCHMCKQLIWESSLNSGIEIQCIIEEGSIIKRIPISDLMPYPWPEKKT